MLGWSTLEPGPRKTAGTSHNPSKSISGSCEAKAPEKKGKSDIIEGCEKEIKPMAGSVYFRPQKSTFYLDREIRFLIV